MAPDYPRAEFRLGPLAPAVQARGPHPNAVVRRDLARAYALLNRELCDLAFSAQEWLLLLDATNGTLFDETSIPLLWAEIDEAIRYDGLAAKWGVDGPALVARLRALSPLQAWAVVDALERVWQAAPAHDGDLRAAVATVLTQARRRDWPAS